MKSRAYVYMLIATMLFSSIGIFVLAFLGKQESVMLMVIGLSSIILLVRRLS